MSPTLSIQIPCFAQADPHWQGTLDLARAADAAGVDRVVVSDHILFGERLEAYADPASGGTAGGRQPTDADGHWLEPLTLLSFVAAQTSRVRVGTAILLAALRTPAVLAKQLATLDVLSGGRLDVGVGVGWQREEYEAAGLRFEDRGALLDRSLMLCRRLWTEQVVDFDDGDLRFERVHAMPKPLQPDGIPLWVAGRLRRRTVERVVRFGNGWIPWGDDIADPAPGIAVLHQALFAAGRDPATLQVQGTLPVVRRSHTGAADADPAASNLDLEATMAGVAPLVAAGVTDFRFHHRWGVDPTAEAALLDEVTKAFRATVGRPTA